MTLDHGPPPRAHTRSQSDVVVEGVKTMIMDGELAAGARLPVEKDLAARLGVSRSSLREGVRALAITGVLETRQGDGTYVTALDPAILLRPIGFLVDLYQPENLVELQSVRRLLEVEAAGRAARHITDAELARAEQVLDRTGQFLHRNGSTDHDAVLDADITFHRVIATASRNPTLEALIEAMASRTARARLWRAVHQDGAELAAHEEHRAILVALRTRDPEAARLRMGVHLLAVEQFLAAHLRATAQDVPVPAQ